jgi:hypothetical protein
MLSSLTLTLGLAMLAPLMPAAAQQAFTSESLTARRAGYERGYRDGFQYGRDVKARNVALDFRTDVYEQGDRGYRAYLGSAVDYRAGFREGYQLGAEDGYRGVVTRLEETFSYSTPIDPDRVRDDRYVTIYQQRRWEPAHVAEDIGYRDGVNAGLKDFRKDRKFDLQDHDAWKEADHGYHKSYGSKDAYKAAYRAAYESGYKDGFGQAMGR